LTLAEIDINALQLEIVITNVFTRGVDAVFGRHRLPELGSDLVTALARLDVNDFSHLDNFDL